MSSQVEDDDSIKSPRKSIVDEVNGSVSYFVKYSTAVLHHVVSESVWVNIDNLPIKPLRIIAFIEVVAWFGICIFFAQETYYQMASETFISIDTDAGICTPIQRYVDLSQLISVNDGTKGYWRSQVGYQTNSSAYRITLENFRSNPIEFRKDIQAVGEKLKEIGERGADRGLPWNLIVWSTFSHRIAKEGTGSLLFNLEGDAKTIFNKDTIYAGVASMYGLCEPDKTRGRWDESTMSYQLIIQDYFSDSPMGKCADMGMLNVDPTSPNNTITHGPDGAPEDLTWSRNRSNSINAAAFGYNPLTAVGDDLTIDFDVRSISIALAINMEQLQIEELSRIAMDDEEGASFPFDYCNLSVEACAGLNVTDWASFYAPRYIGMRGLLCIGIVDALDNVGETKHFCFIRQGSMMLYPTIDHHEHCACSLVNTNDTIKKECNKQDLVVGLLYYSWETYQYFPLTLEAVAFLRYGLYGTSYRDDFLNIYVRPAAITTLRGATEKNVTQDEVVGAYMQICQYYPCSMIVFNAIDEFSKTINGYAFEIKEGACANTVYKEERFDAMTHVPFAFTENYQSCSHTPFNVAVFTVAVSSGNAQIMTQILMFFVTMLAGGILYFYDYKTGFTEELYDEKKKMRQTVKERIRDNAITSKSKFVRSTSKYFISGDFSDGDDDDDGDGGDVHVVL